ncbi:MAG: AarF/ABC1/UbiB kinase family protein [Hyphomicrobiales bacterium]|nr:AarF/ABC1/UbiB kinase family protein [Hyphomicrobiales bacterium]
MNNPPDAEPNRFSRRLSRYARVGANVGGVAAKMAGARLLGREFGDQRNAAELMAALGGLKGPLMKLAQLVATVPDLLPPEYAEELQKLQASAPPMGPAFVKRRMRAELGPEWKTRFESFDEEPSAAASLGQVHKAVGHDGRNLACKLQYPDMQSAVEADLSQLGVIMSVQRRINPEIDTTEIAEELSERLREELDYRREAGNTALYGAALKSESQIRVPAVVPDLSTRRLLTMTWLDGQPLLSFLDHSLEDRNRIATALFKAWWHPFATHGIIHGDPHLGNYSVFDDDGRPEGINLLDYGCIRVFPARFVGGVVELFHGFRDDDRGRIIEAYRRWGFGDLSEEQIDVLNIWARFIYGPLIDDRVRTIADGVDPAAYGRKEVWKVKQALKAGPPIVVPREFVLMDRAAIGLGSVMLHLRAELNFHRIFAEAIKGFDEAKLARRQSKALNAAGLAGLD